MNTTIARRRFTRLAATTLAGGLVLALGACGASPAETDGPAPTTLDVVVHDSFSMSDEAKAAFEKESGLTLNLITTGDGGALANKLVLTTDAPLGDVAFGIDNSFASRAVDAGVFTPYTSPALPGSASDLLLDDAGSLTPIDYGDVCLNIDTGWFADHGVAAAATLSDLTTPAYKDLTVVTNPATSSPGLAFLFATIGAFGQDGYLDYWKQLTDNGLKVVDGWEDAYYTDFTGAGGDGSRPIVLSYASSPAFTVTEDGASTTTAALLGTCFRQVEYAGVLANGSNPVGAQKFIDFLLGDEFQSELPESMYMYPVNGDVSVPADWAAFAPVPAEPIGLDAALISEDRDSWIKAWTASVIG
ncbi:thiamine transport system substrate-binding protein [Sanguibacter gelidistatuariae]|uniref:Thiamine transport system substrate-binding protein n=1 Tax=Sanguibacter gelidistatuariae TaxID=1814289 RepID=A0A1G6GSM5_9MICO|nr:thiamine ABC transporter substrate-binding protein [Sanguibacter gelidistatuariae]SDB84944.1 thiamine transport system substrate-binding protein [Sanguibacter gelidistatuariae]